MLYSTFTVKDKEYKGRLTARALVDLEKKLGTNPINVFIKMSANEGYMPDLQDLITILHGSLQAMEHGISIDKTYEIYDEMIDEGKTIVDLVNIVIDIFKVSGLIPEADEDEKN